MGPARGYGGAAVVVAALLAFQLSSGSGPRHRPAPITGERGLVVGAERRALPEQDRRALTESRARTRPLSLEKAVGQLVIGTYAGEQPSASILDAVRAGHLGGIILMGANTAAGVAATHAATTELQAAARAGGNPGLLIMTDQEGGEVKRLSGPPDYSAIGMADATVAHREGVATGALLRQAGVNVDLAPVADVSRVDGFMTQEQRTFGTDGQSVARAACAFAHGLARSGVAYTLKHFPGLGDAVQSTDSVPVGVSEPASQIAADDAPYRRCGRGPLALVMMSSASYDQLTGSTPAVLSAYVYRTVMRRDRVDAVTISDSFESGAIAGKTSPALTAINAGLDMVLYPGYEVASHDAYRLLIQDTQRGQLDPDRVRAAADKVLTLKAHLGVG